MIQYTTPTIALTVKGINLIGYDLFVSLEQGELELTKENEDLTVSTEPTDEGVNTIITFELSQAESGAFAYGKKALAQVNWLNEQGKRMSTRIGSIIVERNLLNRVIE